MLIQNFGRNIKFEPRRFYRPKTENEVLEILSRHKDGQIRVAGATHAWNGGIASNDAFLDIGFLDKIEIQNGENPYVTAGGGVKLEKLVLALAKQNLMIPAMGGIMQQTLAGLASTATHGTGNSSFSHFIASIRLAAYDSEGQAKIYEFKDGDELKAARTALGCMGVILSMKIPCVRKYWITERSKMIKTIDEVLADEKDWPLQQTVIIPYLWQFLGFQRRIGEEPSSGAKFKFALMRAMDYISLEIMPHVFLKLILMMRNNKNMVVKYYRDLLPSFIRGLTVTNQDYRALTLHTRHHYTFRHVETEIFIPENHLKSAFGVIRQITDWFAGVEDQLDNQLRQQLAEKGLLEEVLAAKNQFVLHYTMFIRKVFPDDALIAMTADNQTYYAIGFFTYDREEFRSGYYAYTKTMAKVLNQLFDARLHWGKSFPLAHGDIARLYPGLEKFKTVCRQVDPKGVFQNDYTRKVLGF